MSIIDDCAWVCSRQRQRSGKGHCKAPQAQPGGRTGEWTVDEAGPRVTVAAAALRRDVEIFIGKTTRGRNGWEWGRVGGMGNGCVPRPRRPGTGHRSHGLVACNGRDPLSITGELQHGGAQESYNPLVPPPSSLDPPASRLDPQKEPCPSGTKAI